jgi:hypothetical protein
MRAKSVWGWVNALIAVCAFGPSRVDAQVTEVRPGDDLEAVINAAQPGDVIELSGGTYDLTDRLGISVRGTEAEPIVVRGAASHPPVLSRAGADQNVIDLDDVEHLVLQNLVITGGSHGLRLVQASFVTIEGCEIYETGDVALSANSGGEYEGLRILRNHIHDTNNTGEGMYLGCNDDACRVFDSLIEGNYIHHTNGPSVEQGDGIELKEGSYNNIVRDNVIHDTKYPCILTYSTAGNGAPNVIERNVLWRCGDNGIQSAADAIIRNNVILSAAASGIAMQPHQAGVPSNLEVLHNTVLQPAGDAIRASGIAGSVLIANNAVYAQSGSAIAVSGDLQMLVATGNVGEGSAEPTSDALMPGSLAEDFAGASFSGAPPNDVFPKAGSALIGAAVSAHVTLDDFNATTRGATLDVGAYVYDEGGNPGWTLAEEPKGELDPVEPVDAGAIAGSGGAGGMMGRPGGMGGMGGMGGTTPIVDAGAQPMAGASSDAAADDAGAPQDSNGSCACGVIASKPAEGRAWLVLLFASALGCARRSFRSHFRRSAPNAPASRAMR